MQKFKETIAASETIAVQIGNTNDPSKVLAARLLHALFLQMGKKSIFRSANADDRMVAFAKTLLPHTTHDVAEKENLIIKINTDQTPIEELKYEKDGATLKIILRGKNALDATHVTIEKEKAPVHLLVLVDPHDDEVEALLKAVPHADVVRLTSKTKSLLYKVLGIVETLRNEIPKDLVLALWTLVLAEEKQNAPSEELFRIKTRLLELGVDHQKVHAARETLIGPGFWKIVGRALARSEFEKELGIVWTFIPHADFEKTKHESTHIFPLFDELRHLRPEGNFLAMLWERVSENGARRSISALVGGGNIDKTRELALLLGSSLASSYFMLEGFATFSEVEIKIRSSVRKMLQ